MNEPRQPKIGRPPHKRETIAAALCQRIIAGEWQPGDRIPTVAELGPLFNVGNPTMHQALKTLKVAGFLEPRGNRGTFVVPHPPHLSRYGLVFPASPYAGWSRLWEAIRQSAGLAEHLTGHQAQQFPLYFSIDPHADSPDYRRLIDDLRLPALAGLIFANAPWPLLRTPLLTQSGIPRVAPPKENPPLPTGARVVAGGPGETCEAACGALGRVCSPGGSLSANDCNLLRDHFRCEAGCIESRAEEEAAGATGGAAAAATAALPAPGYVVSTAPQELRPAMCLIVPPKTQQQALMSGFFFLLPLILAA